MADDEEPFVLDSQEERELRAQVCQLAAEVIHICPITSTCMHVKYACMYIRTPYIH